MKHKKSILEGNIIYTLFAILMGFLTGPGGYCIQSLAYMKNTLRISVS